MPPTAPTAASTVCSMASTSSRRAGGGSTGARRCLASPRAFTGMIAQVAAAVMALLSARAGRRAKLGAEAKAGTRQGDLVVAGVHQGLRHPHRQRHIRRQRRVLNVDDEDVDQAGIIAGNTAAVRRHTQLGHDLGGWALDGLAGNNRGDGDNRRACGPQRLLQPWNRENGIDAEPWVRWADDNAADAPVGQRLAALPGLV